jgi:glucose/arabinose dehydrogenase
MAVSVRSSRRFSVVSFAALALATAAGLLALARQPAADRAMPAGHGPNPSLPAPSAEAPARNFVKVIGWQPGESPTAPAGLGVTRFAEGLDHPRWLYVLPNGDVLVAESNTVPKPPKTDDERATAPLKKDAAMIGPSANRITLLRDSNGDGRVEERFTFLEGLNQPFGMTLVQSTLFVGNTDGVMAFPYEHGATRIDAAKGKKILDLPAGGYNNHWTRNVVASPSGSKLLVTVGSASNAGEHGLAEEHHRANVLECNVDGGALRVYASGLRNPNGLDWEPETGVPWTVVNERDGLGDDLVPDYLTHLEENAFFGWPFTYYGRHRDPRVKEGAPADLAVRTVVPDYALGSHTASLGLVFYRGKALPARYAGGAFITQHGSWNRSTFSGYKVIFVAFQNGKPAGPPEDVVTGFLANPEARTAHGRPVGITVDRAGALLIADDAGNMVWRVAPGATGGS